MGDIDPLEMTGTYDPASDPSPTEAVPATAESIPAKPPERIGRYRIEHVLGKGGFGLVYLAHDEQLKRSVAVKVPHANLISKPEDAEAYLAEARTVANLDHPHVVPVYDIGSTEDCPCYVVSKYIAGTDLATKLKRQRIPYRESAELVATVADALHYAHKRGLVHRDVKPGNILIDHDGKPYVVDFGLALWEENIGQGPKYAGTPAYMSPEQARGEGHRVDGRSDIFSLGVVFYELLAGRQPFRGETKAEVMEQVTSYEAKPLRQYDEKLPKELERICHKAMAKRASERYSSAHDLAEDLRHFLHEQALIHSGTSPGGVAFVAPEIIDSQLASTSVRSTPTSSASISLGSSDNPPIKIVPKGLRSFDAHDSDFFLELLPGPRDREGLPDSLRFWKTLIEETDSDNTFTVGLIYGPSGCGKSSLVKAGLLPRISEDVIPVYIEAAPEETETRLLHGLRKRCPAREDNLSLKDKLAALRRGQGIPLGKKVLIIIDQFEQWLHARKEQENTELVQALRQCDGGHVQCIVMVRDDFWMAVTRFLSELEVQLIQGRNFAPVDLFPIRHAEKVLAAFGRAFGALPDSLRDLNKEQRSFLTQSVAGLAEESKVICVRLALFSEMMKTKAWTPATLKEVGGTKGVGVTFLEETFSTQANPRYKLHQKAARAVLQALLPESGTDIKGHMRSYAELLEASGYANRPKDFDDLIRILDSEIRLITPTDSAGEELDAGGRLQTVPPETVSRETLSATPQPTAFRYYQLTHDYLVHSLREWLTRKQRETRKGRAELKLAERSALWNAKPESRHLPSLIEWLGIRTLTDAKGWNAPQREMILRSNRFHLLRLGLAAVITVLITVAGLWARHHVDQNRLAMLSEKAQEQEATRIEGLVGRLRSAEPTQVPEIVKELDGNPEMAAKYLTPLISADIKTIDDRRSQLHARLALVARDKSLVAPLLEELLTNKLVYIRPIRQLLRPYAGELTKPLWGILRDEQAEAQGRFQAATVLADYVPADAGATWTDQDLHFVARQLVSANAEFQPLLREALRPISGKLLVALEQIFVDPQSPDAQRLSAANAFADYAGSDVPKLTQLLTVATPSQYAVLFPLVAASPDASTLDELSQMAATPPPADLGSVARVPFGQRRANAAVTLLRLGEREKVMLVFDMTNDPEALMQFTVRCRERGVGVGELLDCLQRVSDAPPERYPRHAHYALLLALGEFMLDEIPAARRDVLLAQLADWYRHHPSSGVHGAAGWLLRHWGHTEIVRKVDQTAVPYAPEREWFTLAITLSSPASPKPADQSTEDKAAVKTPETENTKRHDPRQPLPRSENSNLQPAPEQQPQKTFYYTFVVFPAGGYEIGSVTDEPDRSKIESRHPVQLTRSFALLDREITWEELIAFRPLYAPLMQQLDDSSEAAGACADWYDAVSFCRWLGQQSGMSEGEQPYPAPETLDEARYPRDANPGAGWAPRDWPVDLGRQGFRLPLEAEWEAASRVGARTSFGFGSDATLLGRFAWFAENSRKVRHPPRELRPNLRGLFDMHGNLYEWTHDWFVDYGVDGLSDPLIAKKISSRVGRGGSWIDDPGNCRSAFRSPGIPSSGTDFDGIRLALSLPEVLPNAGKAQNSGPTGKRTHTATPARQPDKK